MDTWPSTDVWVAIFTGLLVAVGCLQAWFLHGALNATAKAADAAARNADTLIKQNSPYLRFSTFGVDRDVSPPVVILNITNYGAGRAFLVEMSMNLLLIREPLPPVPQYKDIIPFHPAGMSLDQMDHVPYTIKFPDEIKTAQQLDSGFRTGQRLFVYGFFTYIDVLRQKHTFGFGAEHVNGSFRWVGGANYNYRRVEKNSENENELAN